MSEKFYFGVDVGATFTKTALVSEKGCLVVKEKFLSRGFSDKGRFSKKLKENLFEILARCGLKPSAIKAVGVGLPGPVDPAKGVVLSLTNIKGWDNFVLVPYLRKILHYPVFIENDANCMAFAESRRGAAKGASHALCLTLGTGVGGGLIIERRIYSGPYFLGAEVGHIPVARVPACSCGGSGCLERYVGNQALLAKAKKIFKRGISLEDISALAKKGDRRAKKFWREAGELIGFALSGVVNVFNPQVIVIGGGVSGAGESLLGAIRKSVGEHAMKQIKEKVRIKRALLGNDAGVLGAALLAKERLGERP
jgi:glucokinase